MGMGLCGTGEQETVAESMMPVCLWKSFLRRQITRGVKNKKLPLPCVGII